MMMSRRGQVAGVVLYLITSARRGPSHGQQGLFLGLPESARARAFKSQVQNQ